MGICTKLVQSRHIYVSCCEFDVEICCMCFVLVYSFILICSLSQWLNFKLFGITYLVWKIKFKLFFSRSIGWVSLNIKTAIPPKNVYFLNQCWTRFIRCVLFQLHWKERETLEISVSWFFDDVWLPLLADLLFAWSVTCCFLFLSLSFFNGDEKEQTNLMYEHHESSTCCSFTRDGVYWFQWWTCFFECGPLHRVCYMLRFGSWTWSCFLFQHLRCSKYCMFFQQHIPRKPY